MLYFVSMGLGAPVEGRRASQSICICLISFRRGDKLVLRLGDADGGLPATGFRYRRLRRPDQDHSAPASAIFDVARST